MVEGAALEMLCTEMYLGFESLTLRQKSSVPSGALLLCIKRGFESRLLAICRWPIATGVAFPQKSESLTLRQKSSVPSGALIVFFGI